MARKRLPGDPKRIGVYFSADEIDLWKFCADNGKNVSDFIKDLIRKEIQERESGGANSNGQIDQVLNKLDNIMSLLERSDIQQVKDDRVEKDEINKDALGDFMSAFNISVF